MAAVRRNGTTSRVHRNGSLDALTKRHDQFLNRLQDGWTPVSPLTDADVDQVRYRRNSDTLPRPFATFRLVNEDEDTVAYPHAKLIHIAGMVRHLARNCMKDHPPRDLRGRSPEQWLRQYVAGHQLPEDNAAGLSHAQFSYVPLPSIGHAHTDPAVRRVMIVAPWATRWGLITWLVVSMASFSNRCPAQRFHRARNCNSFPKNARTASATPTRA